METGEILVAIQKAAETIATPNWAAWLSAGAALVAVAVAIVVAVMQIKIAKKQNEIAKEQTKISKKQTDISDKQNKIALFEKRYAVYYELSKIVSLGEELASQEPFKTDVLLCALEAAFDITFTSEQDFKTKIVTITQKMGTAIHTIEQSMFLFPHINEKDVDDLLMDALNFITSISFKQKDTDFESTYVKKFASSSKEFKAKYFDRILSELDLTGEV